MGYRRDDLPVGSPLGTLSPLTINLPSVLRTAKKISFIPGFGKIGDSLLFLSAPLACLDWLRVFRKDDLPEVFIASPYPNLFELTNWGGSGMRVVPTSIAQAEDSDLVILDGEALEDSPRRMVYLPTRCAIPRFNEEGSRGLRVHASLPARRYLKFERDSGAMLGRDLSHCLPSFVHGSGSPSSDPVRIAVIGTTGGSSKQFGIIRYLREIASVISACPSRRFEIFIFASPDLSEIDDEVSGYMNEFPAALQVVSHPDLAHIVKHLSTMDIAVGNDTGVSHLAAMTCSHRLGKLLPVIIVYLGADPSLWTVGQANVFPLHAPVSRLYSIQGASVVTSGQHPGAWLSDHRALAINDNRLARLLLKVLQRQVAK